MNDKAIIRRRNNVRSLRYRDGLIQFAKDQTSQNGEDGVIEELFKRLPPATNNNNISSNGNDTIITRYCVDVGAWDGKHLSNTYSLLVPSSHGNNDHNNINDNKAEKGTQIIEHSSSSHNCCWRGVLIEADNDRFQQLKSLHEPLNNTCINIPVSCIENSRNGLVSLLEDQATSLPTNFDFLCIDVDGSDYWLLHDLLLKSEYRPTVICIEFNPTMPDDLIYIPPRDDNNRHGASLSALYDLVTTVQEDNNRETYILVETTLFNAFFVKKMMYEQYLKELVPDTSIEALHDITMGTSLYQLYDGTIKLWGCRKLLWHRIPIDEKKIQVIPDVKQRVFPFAPPSQSSSSIPSANDKELYDTAVDMSSYCKNNGDNNKNDERVMCANALWKQLQLNGFALVRGTGIKRKLCVDALQATNSFLQTADESVRRSCLTKDRARRGYSPMNTENFASLIGEERPNDLVRKFRIGPTTKSFTSSSSDDVDGVASSSSPLLRPNIWPTSEAWNDDDAPFFRSSLESYYKSSCSAAHSIVGAICDGLLSSFKNQPDFFTLEESLKVFSRKDSIAHTSILTMLGYRSGTRHKKGKAQNKPLVAAHTDVGVITFLMFDSGDCAMLQRAEATDKNQDYKGKDEGSKNNSEFTAAKWTNVTLPNVIVNDDPVFVLNIGDCFSELSNKLLPSTLHRVIPQLPGSIPRNCLALFVGLDPDDALTLPNDESMSYEEWRKKRIARAQQVLKSSSEKKSTAATK